MEFQCKLCGSSMMYVDGKVHLLDTNEEFDIDELMEEIEDEFDEFDEDEFEDEDYYYGEDEYWPEFPSILILFYFLFCFFYYLYIFL